MKKAIIFVIIIALLGALGIIGYKTLMGESILGTQSGSGDNSGENGIEHTNGLASKVRVEAVNVRNKTDNIDINNVFPAIKSFSNKEFENSINKQIASNIENYRAEISYMVADIAPEEKLKFYKYVTTYEKHTWGNYLTLVVDQDYQTGGIRSNSWKDIYNIDVSKERIIYLEDIFPATVDFEQEIINEITKQAATKNIKLMGGDGLTKLPTKQKFYIEDGKLYVYFDPSEIAGNVYGALEFEMPFTLNSNGHFEVN